MSDYHGRMMNIPCPKIPDSAAFALGHREARHAAAQIANEADDEILALRKRLAEATELLREARDDVVEASNHTYKPHAVAYYKEQIACIDAFLTPKEPT